MSELSTVSPLASAGIMTGFSTTIDAAERLSVAGKLALPLSEGDVPLFNDDGSPNYRGHVALDSDEKARAYGFGFLVDDARQVANPCIEKLRVAMRSAYKDRAEMAASLTKDTK